MIIAKTKQGYQKTKLGWIPEDWEVKILGDIGSVRMCKRIFNDQTLPKGDIPFYKISTFGKSANAYITKEVYDEYRIKYSFPKKGDILISASGTIGRLVVYDGKDAYFQDSNIIWIDNNESLVLNCYLYFVLQRIRYNTEGGTIKRLYNSSVKSSKFIYSPLPEQKKIAKILSTWDSAITKTKALIQKKQALKKGLMQVLLTGKVRTSNNSNWKTFVLSELGSTYNGLTGKTKEHFGKGKPFITYMNIFKNEKIDSSIYDLVEINENDKQNQVQYGDIFFTVSSETPHEIGMTSVLLDNLKETYLNSFCFGFRLNDFCKLLPEYAVYYFRGEEFRREMIQLAQGATRFNLSKKNTLKLKLELPPMSEQQEIAKVLSTCDQAIEKLNQQLQVLQAQKKGLMQQLLTGATRVSV